MKSRLCRANGDMNVPIYGIAFGWEADLDLVCDHVHVHVPCQLPTPAQITAMSRDSRGFSEHIEEEDYAALKLEDFYLRTADPRLTSESNAEQCFVNRGRDFRCKSNWLP